MQVDFVLEQSELNREPISIFREVKVLSAISKVVEKLEGPNPNIKDIVESLHEIYIENLLNENIKSVISRAIEKLEEANPEIEQAVKFLQEIHEEDKKRLLEELKISYPDNLKIGAAIGAGDCFFDAVAQGLKQIKPGDKFTVKSLRKDCAEYAKEHKDNLLDKITNDAESGGYFTALEGPYGPIQDPTTNMNIIDKEETFNKYLRKITSIAMKDYIPIWGRPDIEGSIICNKYKIKLYVIRIQEQEYKMEGNKQQIVKKLAVTKFTPEEDSKCLIEGVDLDELNKESLNDKDAVSTINYNNHFVPFLNNINEDIEEVQKVSKKEVYGEDSPSLLEDMGNYDLGTNSQLEKRSQFKQPCSAVKVGFMHGSDNRVDWNTDQQLKKVELKIVQLLFDNRADINIKNNCNETSLEVAERLDNREIITALEKHLKDLLGPSRQQASFQPELFDQGLKSSTVVNKNLKSAVDNNDYTYWLQQHDIAAIARACYGWNNKEDSHIVFEVIGSTDQLSKCLEEYKNEAKRGKKQTFIFIINLNNNHWVTLVVVYHNQQFFAYYTDSLNGNRFNEIKKVVENSLSGVDCKNVSDAQQRDGCNCGIFALENAGIIREELLRNNVFSQKEITNRISQYKPGKLALEMKRKEFAQKLMNEQERQQFKGQEMFSLSLCSQSKPEFYSQQVSVEVLDQQQIQCKIKGSEELRIENTFKAADRKRYHSEGSEDEHRKKILKTSQRKIETKTKQMRISTHRYTQNYLESAFSVLPYTLEPLSKKDQKDFLKKFWKKKKESNQNFGTMYNEKRFEECCEKYSDELLGLFSRSISVQEREFIGIHLLIQMLAEVYQEVFKEFYDSNKDKPDNLSQSKLSLLILYQSFIKHKFEIYKEENEKINLANQAVSKESKAGNQLEQLFEKEHRLFAMKLLFSENQLNSLLTIQGKEEIKKLINEINSGEEKNKIVGEVVVKKPYFIHQAFAEYFAASWFYDELKKKKKYLLFFLKNVLNEEHQVLCNFINNQLDNETINKLKEYKDDEIEKIVKGKEGSTTLLHFVAKYEYSKLAKYLIENGGEVKFKDHESRTPLHYAAENGHKDVVDSLLNSVKNNPDALNALTATDNYGKTPLHNTARNGHKVVVDTLLNHVKYNLKALKSLFVADKEHRTPLHYAAENGHKDVVDSLLNSVRHNLKALKSLFVSDIKGRTPLHYATSDVVDVLLNSVEGMPDALDVLTTKDRCGRTALFFAAQNGHKDVVDALLNIVENKPDALNVLIATDIFGKTPLHNSARNGHKDVVNALLNSVKNNYKVLKSLFASDSEWRTPLHYAAKNGHKDVVDVLLSTVKNNSKDLESLFHADIERKTPLCYAIENHHKDVVDSLVNSVIDNSTTKTTHTCTSNNCFYN